MQLLKGLVAAAALSVVALGAQAADYKAEYKVSTVVGSAFPWGKTADRWAELVDERTDGRIKMKIYPGAQLVQGDQTKEFTAIRQGIIDMAVGSTINWSPQVKELNLFSLPFLMPDYEAIDALTQGEVGQKIFEAIDAKGVLPLAWAENGFRELSNSKHAVRTPADLDGMKIRVVGSPLYNDTFTALGANPTQMSWADAQPALSTGAVDGQENPMAIYGAAKLYTLEQTHLTMWRYVADPLVLAVSKRVWETFTPEDQAVVREAAVEAGRYGVELAREGLTGDNPPYLDELRELGVEVVELTPEERAQFVEATRPVYDAWKEKIGSELVDMAEQAIGE